MINNKIEHLKQHIKTVEKDILKYMSTLTKEEINTGKEIVKAYYSLELGINKPLPLNNDDDDLSKTWRSDGRNQLMRKIFKNLNLDLEVFYTDFIIEEMLKDWVESPDTYVEVTENGTYKIFEDINDKDDYFTINFYYNNFYYR